MSLNFAVCCGSKELYCIPAVPNSVHPTSQLWADECSIAGTIAPHAVHPDETALAIICFLLW